MGQARAHSSASVRQLRLEVPSHVPRSAAHRVGDRARLEAAVAARRPGLGQLRVAREENAQGHVPTMQVLDAPKLLAPSWDGPAGVIALQGGWAHLEELGLGRAVELPERLEDAEQEPEGIAGGQARLRPGIPGALDAGQRQAEHPELAHRPERDLAHAPTHRRHA